MTKSELQGKWWYRLIQVIFGFFLIICLIILCISFYTLKPHKVVDREKTTFICTDKDSDKFNQSYGFKGTTVYLWETGTLSYSDEKSLNSWCADGDYLYTGNGTYYKLNLVYKMEGTWEKFAFEFIGSLAGLFLVLAVIRRIFLYVLLGKQK